MEQVLSNNHCKLLRCALEVIGRTSAVDSIRITTVPSPIENKPETTQNQNTTNPHSSQNEHQDRVQRRKEKKRRKMELRKQRREESTIKSEVVTTTSFSTKAAVSVLSDSSQADVSIPLSVRAIIHVKPLIILDVNGILCHRLRHKPEGLQSSASHRRSKKITTFRPSIGHVANTDIVPRSDLHQFLTSLNSSFSLAVWTSATRKTAKQLVQLLFPDEIRENLVFVWHRNFCNLVDNTDPEVESNSNNNNNESVAESQKKPSHEDTIAIKPLSKVWASFPIWNASNTLLLDDSPEKCVEYRKNALHPTKIVGTNTDFGGVYFDNDEENQKMQRDFFELLASNWTESSSSEYLQSFLEENAKKYNMDANEPE